jgi:hypothetical protein
MAALTCALDGIEPKLRTSTPSIRHRKLLLERSFK